MTPRLIAGFVTLALLATAAPLPVAAKQPTTWDNLVLVKAKKKKLAGVYLLPDADFRPYTKIMMDETEVAFQKNWQRNYNSNTVGSQRRIDSEQAQKIADMARTGFEQIFADAYTAAGYQLVTQPGPDVLRVGTAIINLAITAPDTMSAGISRTYSADAGEATLVLEVRDSTTGAVLGRAVDSREAGDMPAMRTAVSNRADFERLFKSWAKASANGLAILKANSPINANGEIVAPPKN